MQIVPTLPPAPPAAAGLPAPAEAGEGGFAELLKGESARPPAGDAAAADTPAQGAEPGTEGSGVGDAADTADTSAATEDAAADAPGAATLDPGWAQWLAGLHMPAPAEPRGTRVAAWSGADAADGNEAGPAAPISAAAARGGLRGAAGTTFERAGADGRAVAKDTGRETALPMAANDDTTRIAASAPAAPAAAARQAGFELPSAAPLSAAAAPAPASLTAPAPVVDVQLPLAPDAAGFGEAFATQVSVLARDGVQQAELHLNPAETGPVSIQIVLEGTQARIDFGADALPTRQAIERSLPELAAALREEGLTLSGGGVSEHPRGREAPAPDGATAATARRGGDPGSPAPVLHAVRTPRPAGGIDLYA